ncbi:MAG: heavy metal transporter [Bdellovibrionales bacterium GWB1_55_8]|nr:MAG: heavy metal transporter [Bdellovibrionales bacterium GWB1_55_8]
MANITLKVQGMTCDGCVRSVKKVLEPISGVKNVNVSLDQGQVAIEYDDKSATKEDFKSAIEDAGFDVLS